MIVLFFTILGVIESSCETLEIFEIERKEEKIFYIYEKLVFEGGKYYI